MKNPVRLLLVLVACLALYILLNFPTSEEKNLNHVIDYQQRTSSSNSSDLVGPSKASVAASTETVQGQVVVICVVACGADRLDESLTMLKSALVFAKRPLRFIVISDYGLIPAFHEKLTEWKQIVDKTFDFIVRPVTFPDISDVTMWRKLFKPCAAQRLFLPTVLNDTDAILYVDTDTLFLAPPEVIWDEFKKMNNVQLAALSPEHEDPNTGWYNRFAKHPYYGKLGVNSGVMLMNLTRMREFKWTQYVIPIHKEYRLKITWGDQDIINIIFHYHPEKLHVYDCRYNYRPDHCMYMSVCPGAEKKGALVLHGSRGTFHSQKQPPFKSVYTAMQEYQLNTDPYKNLLVPMKTYLTLAADHSNCGQVWKVFIIQPELHLGRKSEVDRK
ncbi:glucoside xylosyltransferase 1 [Nasonia vitripennis]|uniref:UDP-D-xylose:beta-D-glucoside alpha-1,3-D-xylosyltransferase n=1 Tax=Nasonia vitripennis TaxID=7425 RepID=A0A7M7QPK6_NASVI|nr:glucoside xylosyltransferase 1 [Nasonia vitripennis]XP_032451844.1 glucoside xylosyltransferase 1 [Nasonia vitripennis]